ncbi:shikimate kinase [Companilactobacillus jidongensis]|uniref:shikimate kinase n=1 Tax=Companilactobacillus jidongensis TaxID=2486006 RepID=UPI000F7B04F8|nr:shikimate kinase [Companilactobacillus jidongensis]
MSRTIILIGFMGAGKTTVGTVLANITNRPLLDLDDEFTRERKLSPKKFMEQFGEEKFRKAETKILESQLSFDGIISTGGGVVESRINRQLIQESTAQVIYLKTNLSNVLERLSHDNVRPMLRRMSVIDLQNCWNRRGTFYQLLSDVTIETTNKKPIKIAREIIESQQQNDLLPLRSKIDSLDRQIFELISQRFDVVKEVATVKEQAHTSVVKTGRMKEMRAELKNDFKDNKNISEQLIEDMMSILFSNSIKYENEQIKKVD